MTTETTARIDAAEYARQQKLIDEWLAQRLDGLRRSMRLPADDAAWNLYDEERFAIQARVQSLEHQNLRNLQGPMQTNPQENDNGCNDSYLRGR